MNDYEVESLETDYTNRCGNCHEFLEKNDKYGIECVPLEMTARGSNANSGSTQRKATTAFV